MARFSCPTCAATYAVLRAAKVPGKVAKPIAYSKAMKNRDRKLKQRGKRLGSVRRASDYSRKLSKHLKKERAKAIKKNGDFKKGWSQARVMKAAHKCVKKEMRR
jgi:hypothetical protein